MMRHDSRRALGPKTEGRTHKHVGWPVAALWKIMALNVAKRPMQCMGVLVTLTSDK